MGKAYNWAGEKVGSWIVSRLDVGNFATNGCFKWICECECGNATRSISAAELSRGRRQVRNKTMSCGCNTAWKIQRVKDATTKHGQSRHRLYKILDNMKSRCYNKSAAHYDSYGGRGIYICEEWLHSYELFRDWALVNGYESHLQIDRKDPNGHYAPNNCRWVTPTEQANNSRRTVWLTAFGETKTLLEWLKDPRCADVSNRAIRSRLKKGWEPERALTTPNKQGMKLGVHCISHNTVWVNAFGERKPITEWSQDERCVVNKVTIRYRLSKGWSAETAISTPPNCSPVKPV